MQITAITQQKRNIENVNVFLEGKFWISLSKNQMLELKIIRGMPINEELKKKSEDASQKNKLFEKVYNFISIRPRSEKEVFDYLVYRKDVDEIHATEIVAEFIKKELISDDYFANWLVTSRIRTGKYGENKIKVELLKKGISNEIIKKTFSEIKKDEEYEEKKIEDIKKLVKKLTVNSEELNRETRNKLVQKLMARGFLFNDIKTALNNNEIE